MKCVKKAEYGTVIKKGFIEKLHVSVSRQAMYA